MTRTASFHAILLAAFALTACGTPESDCRQQLERMKTRTQNLVGFGQPDEIRQALEQVNSAETQLATGNYQGCLESLEQAGALLNRSQRTNQQ